MTARSTDLAEPAINIPVEQALLGAVLLDNRLIDRLEIEPEHLSEPVHQRILLTARTLHAQGTAANPLTLRDSLPDIEVVKGLPLSVYLARLCAEAVTTQDVRGFERRLKTLAAIRGVVAETKDLAEAKIRTAVPEEALAEFRDRIDAIFASLSAGTSDVTTIEDSTKRVVDHFTEIMQGKRARAGIPSGLVDLDRYTGGFKHGDLVIVAGRPGSGKSTLGASIGRHIAALRNEAAALQYGVGFFSLEMPEQHIAARMLTDQACHDGCMMTYNAVLQNGISDDETVLLADAQAELRAMPFLLDCSSRLSVTDLHGRIRGMRTGLRRRFGVGLDIVVVDYLKFLKASERYAGQRVLEVGEISAGLKAIAKEEDVCMVLLAQLNRDVEKRENRRPQLSDLRASGELEEDADVVLLTYREAYYIQTHPKIGDNDVEGMALQDRLEKCKHIMDITVAKNRMGPTGHAPVWCHMGAGAIRSAAQDYAPAAGDAGGYAGVLDPGWQPPEGQA